MSSFYGIYQNSFGADAAGGAAGNYGTSRSGAGLDSRDVKSWYEAMARAWGETLDNQAQVISELSDTIGNAGGDQPSSIVQLTAESLRMQFLSNNAATANNSVGQALEALGRKQ